jgi:raffinose/stachyose/melibiose transport system permease protein
MLVQNPIGLLLAVLLSSPKLRFSGTYRTLIFMPTMLSVVIIGFVWQLLLSPLWGIAKHVMRDIGLGDYFDA